MVVVVVVLRDDGTLLGGGVLNHIVAIGERGRRECYQEAFTF
jgi:hypothetical protein